MNLIHIDIETRSECDINLGAYRYATDPTTEVLCVVLKNTRGELNVYEGDYGELNNLLDFKSTLCAHNAAFEYNILKHVLGIEIPIDRWRCSMAVAAYHNLPMSLGACAMTLGLGKQKDEEGKKIMMKMCKPLPVRQQKANGGKWFMNDEAMQTLVEYCVDDVLTEEAIFERLGFLPEDEQKLWEHDMHINHINGVGIDTEYCEAALKLAEKTKEDINDQCQKEHGFKLTQVAEIGKFCGLPDTKAPTVRDALEGDGLDDEQRQVLEWRQIVGNTSPSKLVAAINMTVNGRAYGLLQYSGATQTHRWAGRGLQIQNFPRGSLSEDWTDEEMGLFVRKIKEDNVDQLIGAGLASDPIDAIKSSLRGMFVGDFAVCDYAQIEARVLPWLAGQEDLLESFRRGEDLYKKTASQIYRKNIEDVTKQERFIGKIGSLSCGFGGSKKAFIGMAEVYGVKDMDGEFAQEVVEKWREANSRITRFWYKLSDAAINCVKFGDSTRFRKIHFKKEDEFLKMQLPSGKELFYYKPEIHDHPKFNRESLTFIKLLGPLDAPMKGSSFSGFSKKMGRVFTSGPRLVENATQSVARDVLADAMLRLPKENISFTVHDEIICEGIEQSELESIMLQAPTWAEGLPIGVDSWAGERYRK